jgi:protein ImuA
MVTFGLGPSGLVDAGSLQVREAAREVVSSGFRPLDSLLPAGGIRRGSLIEWLAGGAIAGGAATLAAAVACRLARAAQRSRTILVVDRSGWFHPPAILPWLGREGSGLQLVVARPSRDEDEIWAIDQGLRCAGVAAVLAWPRMQAGGAATVAAARTTAVVDRDASLAVGGQVERCHRVLRPAGSRATGALLGRGADRRHATSGWHAAGTPAAARAGRRRLAASGQ